MSYGTTRISTAAQSTLRELSKAEGKPMLALLDEAVEILRRRRFLEQVNDAYAALRADQGTWEAVLAERQTWDATLIDGLGVAKARASYQAKPRSKRGRR